MCDYSLNAIASRDARVGEELVTTNFGTGTRGFASPLDPRTAVCVRPGTELAFANPVTMAPAAMFAQLFTRNTKAPAGTAIFRQIDTHIPATHHDCLEFPNGTRLMLTMMEPGQTCRVLQLPAAPRTDAERQAQTRIAVKA